MVSDSMPTTSYLTVVSERQLFARARAAPHTLVSDGMVYFVDDARNRVRNPRLIAYYRRPKARPPRRALKRRIGHPHAHIRLHFAQRRAAAFARRHSRARGGATAAYAPPADGIRAREDREVARRECRRCD